MLYVCGMVESRVLFTRIARRWKPMRLLVADGGEAGLRLSRERHLGLIVVDAHLPDADAVEVVGRLTRHRGGSAPPVLVLGHDVGRLEHTRFVWAGASGYVARPLDLHRLDRAVHQLLAGSVC